MICIDRFTLYITHYGVKRTCMGALEVHMPAHTRWQGTSVAYDPRTLAPGIAAVVNPDVQPWLQDCSLSGTRNA